MSVFWAWVVLYVWIGLGAVLATLMIVDSVRNIAEAERIMRGRR